MNFKAPAPKRKHNLWQRNKSYPASVGLCGAVCALQRTRAKRKHTLWQRNISVVCYVALCGAVRAFASKFSKFAANVQKARRCVVLCTDMFQCLLALCEAYGGFWSFSRQLQLPTSSARTAAS